MKIHAGLRQVQLVQGEMKISTAPDILLVTVLGSCISACLYDPQAGIGGMNHFLRGTGGPAEDIDDLSYGESAMQALLSGLMSRGAAKDRLEAKLFGGGRVASGLRDIGADNAGFAHAFLRRHGIPCIAESLGGMAARRVSFHPSSGRALQKLIPATEVAADLQRPPPAGRRSA